MSVDDAWHKYLLIAQYTGALCEELPFVYAMHHLYPVMYGKYLSKITKSLLRRPLYVLQNHECGIV